MHIDERRSAVRFRETDRLAIRRHLRQARAKVGAPRVGARGVRSTPGGAGPRPLPGSGRHRDRRARVTVDRMMRARRSILGLSTIEEGTSMEAITPRVRRFAVGEDGPTAVEYAVMLALIIAVCVTVIRAL